jgi:uncharacterized repeat protein (TIGR03803 family)
MQILYMFSGYADGAAPDGTMAMDQAGNLYGTVYSGGDLNGCGGYGCGVVFELNTNNLVSVLHTFTAGPDGSNPAAGLVRSASGVAFNGVTFGGGSGPGVVFNVAPRPTPCKVAFCPWNLTPIHTFDFNDGNGPVATLIRDAQNNLYGTTEAGGAGCQPDGCGTVFKIDAQGQHTILHSFNSSDGNDPMSTMLLDAAGNIYGTTYYGGTYNQGVVFELDPNGLLTVLWNFTGGADGANPVAGVIADKNGILYGTTQFGGTYGDGVVYKVDPGTHIETPIHQFRGLDGEWPLSPLLMDNNGNFYGTTAMGGPYFSGVVYELDAQYHETTLHNFTFNDGYYPTNGSLLMDQQGNLYGTTNQGGDLNSMAPPCYIQGVGAFGCGVVFKLSPQ